METRTNEPTEVLKATELFKACVRKDAAAVSRHIVTGARDINVAGPEGVTPLMIAMPHIGIMTALLTAGANFAAKDAQGHTAAEIARIMEWSDARALLICCQSVAAATAHDMSIQKVSETLAAECVGFGGFPRQKQAESRSPSWKRLARACDADDADAAHEAIRAGAAVDGSDGHHPLHDAAEYGSVSVIKVLLRAGADPNQCDYLGMTPLHRAFFLRSHVASARVLLDAGVRADSGIDDWYALHHAVSNNSVEGVKLLVEHGANPFAIPPYGVESAYNVAIRQGLTGIAKMFERMEDGR
jgi:ankyrin repeat protein